MRGRDPARDERTVAVEQRSYQWAYYLLSFGLLGATAYRSLVDHQASWDLLGLVVLGGLVATGYQAHRRVVTRRRAAAALGTVAVGGLIALLVVLLGR